MSYKKTVLLLLGVAGMLFLLCPALALAGQKELAASIAETRTELASSSEQLKGAKAALNNLQDPADGDLKKAYDTFVEEVKKVETASTWAKMRAEMMQTTATGHFDSWQADIDSLNNAELRKASQNRLTKVQKAYDEAVAEMKKAAALFKPYISDLSDISKVLLNDLTPKGVSSINSVIRQAKGNLQALTSAIDEAMEEMTSVEKTLSSN